MEVVITSLIEMLDFKHMTTSTLKFESPDKVLLFKSWTKIIKFAYKNTVFLRIAGKLSKTLIKRTFKSPSFKNSRYGNRKLCI